MFDKRVKTQTVHCLDGWDFDEIVKENYPDAPRDFSFGAWEELADDVSQSYQVIKRELNKWDKESLQAWNPFNTYIILNDLCNKGIIPEGSCVIEHRS